MLPAFLFPAFSLAVGLKPAADVDLRVPLAAVVARTLRVRRFLGPLEDVQLQIAAVDHNPSAWLVALQPANLTSIDGIDHSLTPR